jgi:hypothetical protein
LLGSERNSVTLDRGLLATGRIQDAAISNRRCISTRSLGCRDGVRDSRRRTAERPWSITTFMSVEATVDLDRHGASTAGLKGPSLQSSAQRCCQSLVLTGLSVMNAVAHFDSHGFDHAKSTILMSSYCSEIRIGIKP